jgi:hypothetical protein
MLTPADIILNYINFFWVHGYANLTLIKSSLAIICVKWKTFILGNSICPHYQGSDVSRYPECILYVTAWNWYSWLNRVKHLLHLVLLSHWYFIGLFKHFSHRIPAWLRVEPLSLLKLLGCYSIYIALSWCSPSVPLFSYYRDLIKIKSVNCIDAAFCHSRLPWVAKTCTIHMLFESGLNSSASLSDIYFTTFRGDTAYTRNFQMSGQVYIRDVPGIQSHQISDDGDKDGS